VILKDEYNLHFILGVLNSRVNAWFIDQTATQMRGGWRSYEARFIRHIPIPEVSEELQAPIIENVRQILADPHRFDVRRLQAEIDRQVYQLYGLTDEEIELVEGAT